MSDFIDNNNIDESGYYKQQAFDAVPAPVSFEPKDQTGAESEEYAKGWNDAVEMMTQKLKEAFK